MDKVELILTEIERIEGILDDYANNNKNVIDNGIVTAKRNVLKQLKSFINTLPEENVSEDLEDSAEKYAYEEYPSIGVPNTVIELAYKAGAKWQEKKDEKVIKASWDDGYKVGRADGGEEVFQDAAEAKVVGIGDTTCINTLIKTETKIENLNLGDKVRVIYKKY